MQKSISKSERDNLISRFVIILNSREFSPLIWAFTLLLKSFSIEKCPFIEENVHYFHLFFLILYSDSIQKGGNFLLAGNTLIV